MNVELWAGITSDGLVVFYGKTEEEVESKFIEGGAKKYTDQGFHGGGIKFNNKHVQISPSRYSFKE